jgi:diguanylate cyclase (GGDEF)-like protein
MRASDIVCRYGGEEFVLVFALSDETDTLGRLEAMLAEFSALTFQGSSGSELRCTFSAGISSACAGAETLPLLLEQADRAMYAAKEAGRNCIQRASLLPETPALP